MSNEIVEVTEDSLLQEETVVAKKIEFSLPTLDEALWPLRRSLAWGVRNGKVVRFVEANCRNDLIASLDMDAPIAVSDALSSLAEQLSGLDLDNEVSQLERQSAIYGDVMRLDELMGLPLPIRRLRKVPTRKLPPLPKKVKKGSVSESSSPENTSAAALKTSGTDELIISDLDAFLVEASGDEVRIDEDILVESSENSSDDDGKPQESRPSKKEASRWTLENAPTLESLDVDEGLRAALSDVGIITIGDLFLKRPVSFEHFNNVQGAGRVSEDGRVAVGGRVAGWSTTFHPDDTTSEMLYLHGADTMAVQFEGDAPGWFKRMAVNKKKMVIVADYDGSFLTNPEVVFSDNTKSVSLAQYAIPNVQDSVIRDVLRAHGHLLDLVIDPLPNHLKKRVGLSDLADAIKGAHADGDADSMSRMVFDESLLVQLGQRVSSGELAALTDVRQVRGYSHVIKYDKLAEFLRNMDIDLSNGELYALEQIKRDLASKIPMNRLLSGDVGLGRWLVSLCATVMVVQEKSQVVILTPDSLTSRLRYLFTRPLLEEIGFNSIRIVGEPTAGQLELLKNGKAQVVFASSSLLTNPNAKFRRLGLVITEERDERGRVSDTLEKRRGNRPDLLSFTVLPITTVGLLRDYPDADISWLTGEPSPLECRIFGARARNEAYREIAERTTSGQHQAIIMLPMVNGSDALGLPDTLALASTLESEVLSGLKVVVFHGAMDEAEGLAAYRDFRARRYDVMLTTTMFEVGRSLPHVKTILIEQADGTPDWRIRRILGHFRRQVSRCLFVTGNDPDQKTVEYIQSLVAQETVDVALDKEFEVSSTEGLPKLNWIDLSSARDVIVATRREVSRIFDVEIQKRPADYGALSESLRTRWPRYFDTECPLAEVKGTLTRRRRRRRRR